MNCSNCGSEISENDNHCHNCGEKLKDNCQKCGTTLEEKFNYCPKCKNNLEDNEGGGKVSLNQVPDYMFLYYQKHSLRLIFHIIMCILTTGIWLTMFFAWWIGSSFRIKKSKYEKYKEEVR